jgi:hypothetical protein
MNGLFESCLSHGESVPASKRKLYSGWKHNHRSVTQSVGVLDDGKLEPRLLITNNRNSTPSISP